MKIENENRKWKGLTVGTSTDNSKLEDKVLSRSWTLNVEYFNQYRNDFPYLCVRKKGGLTPIGSKVCSSKTDFLYVPFQEWAIWGFSSRADLARFLTQNPLESGVEDERPSVNRVLWAAQVKWGPSPGDLDIPRGGSRKNGGV